MRKFPLICLILVGFIRVTKADAMFTNLKCNVLDKTLVEFQTCHIKPVNRTHKYMDIYIKLLQKSLDNIKGRVRCMRFDNGYKVYYVDVRYDTCQFLKNRKNPLLNALFKAFKDRTNFNHTCPFDHDLIIDKLYTGNLEKDLAKLLPIPNGDYAVFNDWYINNKPVATINIYYKVTKK